jgi:phosphoribosylamine--glycine ligase
MKAMIIGSGAREHAIAWAMARGRSVREILCAPGNAGTAALGENLDIDPSDHGAVVSAAKARKADFVFIGPEQYLAEGLADALEAAGIPAVGPKRLAARLESSKAFSKAFCLRHGIPTARAKEFRPGQQAEFEAFMRKAEGRWVMKKSGLAAGKGVLQSTDIAELAAFGFEVLKGDSLVAEEFLSGWEVSIFALCDGKDWRLLPPASDYKKALDGDLGPNTGGMGCICPNPRVDAALMRRIELELVRPTFRGLAAEGLMYKGVVYFGVMVTPEGPRLLEYNARFGDPETQVVLPLVESDFGEIAWAMATGSLKDVDIAISGGAAVGVVIAAEGYPGSYEKGLRVDFKAPPPDSLVFHASTRLSGGATLTGGGRCFTIVGRGADIKEARRGAYAAIGSVSFRGAWHRKDIGESYSR